jgi:hypothetical protein
MSKQPSPQDAASQPAPRSRSAIRLANRAVLSVLAAYGIERSPTSARCRSRRSPQLTPTRWTTTKTVGVSRAAARLGGLRKRARIR